MKINQTTEKMVALNLKCDCLGLPFRYPSFKTFKTEQASESNLELSKKYYIRMPQNLEPENPFLYERVTQEKGILTNQNVASFSTYPA